MNQSITECKSCGKSIVFLKTGTDKLIPVDSHTLLDSELLDYQNGREIFFNNKYHLTHFVTCPNASHHRRSKS